jgi:hypothetical protein
LPDVEVRISDTQILVDFLIGFLIFLMNERKTDIILEFSDGEIKLDFVLEIGIFVDPIEE